MAEEKHISADRDTSSSDEDAKRAELLAQIDIVNAQIQKKVAALLAHPNVPEEFKAQLEKFCGGEI